LGRNVPCVGSYLQIIESRPKRLQKYYSLKLQEIKKVIEKK